MCWIVVHSKIYLFHFPSKMLKSCRSSLSLFLSGNSLTSGPLFHCVFTLCMNGNMSEMHLSDLLECICKCINLCGFQDCEMEKQCIRVTVSQGENADRQQYLRDSTNTHIELEKRF